MKSLIIYGLLLSIINCDKFNEAMTKLDDLEKYANDFYNTISKKINVNNLILSYIRSIRYNSSEWSTVAGEIPKEFINYTEEQDKKTGKNTSDLRNYKENEIVLPDLYNSTTDFVHMYAVMNGISYKNSFTEPMVVLQGWGGDTAQLFQDLFNLTENNTENLVKKAREFLGIKGRFGKADLISDLDAVGYFALRKNNPGKTYSSIFKSYLKNLNTTQRVGKFLQQTFSSLCKGGLSKEEYRKQVYDTYNQNTYIKIWECKQGLREQGMLECYTPGEVKTGKGNHRMAAAYAFADYLFENKPIFPNSSSYNKFCFLLLFISLLLVF